MILYSPHCVVPSLPFFPFVSKQFQQALTIMGHVGSSAETFPGSVCHGCFQELREEHVLSARPFHTLDMLFSNDLNLAIFPQYCAVYFYISGNSQEKVPGQVSTTHDSYAVMLTALMEHSYP